MDESRAKSMLDGFDPALALAEATPPPASWYREATMLQLEKQSVFRRNWLVVGRMDQLAQPGDYFTGTLLGQPYVVTCDEQGTPKAFHNVCLHHGTRVADGCGNTQVLTCPYHGWQYALDGRLKKAPRAGAIAALRKRAPGLRPLPLCQWGPFLLISFREQPPLPEQNPELNGELAPLALDKLRFITRRTYELNANWKIFVDNYLDGGYHVPHMHPDLAGKLETSTYQTRLGRAYSLQTCRARDKEGRLGDGADYLWLYPNFMLNRYGPWMDTNTVFPLGPERCLVVFDYYHEGTPTPAELAQTLASSDQVQQEDMAAVHMVQDGMGSEAYQGMYAPNFEASMYQFHQLLHRDLTASPTGPSMEE